MSECVDDLADSDATIQATASRIEVTEIGLDTTRHRGRLSWWSALGSALLAVLVGGCIFPDRGTAIAKDVTDAKHPLIAKVEYNGDDDDSGPRMDVVLRPGATRDDARTVVCQVVKPAIERGSPPQSSDLP